MSYTEHFLLKTKTADYQASDQEISLRQLLRVYAAFLHLLLLTLTLLREHHTYINDRNIIPVLSLYIAQSWSRLIQLFSMKNAASSATRLSIITLIIFLSFTKNALPLQCGLYGLAKLRTFWSPSTRFFLDLCTTQIQILAERKALESLDRSEPPEHCHTQKNASLSKLDSVIIKEPAFKIKPRLIVLCDFLPSVNMTHRGSFMPKHIVQTCEPGLKIAQRRSQVMWPCYNIKPSRCEIEA